MKKLIPFLFLLIIAKGYSHAAIVNSVQSGNWQSAATWTSPPQAGDVINILAGDTVTVPQGVFAVIQSSSSIVYVDGILNFTGINCNLQLHMNSEISVYYPGAILTPSCDPNKIYIRMCHPGPDDPLCLYSAAELCALNGLSYKLTSSGTAPLPIELTEFTAEERGKKIKLSWTTATELDNDFFEIQRTGDLRTGNWELIGRVEGAGTTNLVQRYTFIDESPLNGDNYYQLKQVDFDGTFEISFVVVVKFFSGNVTISPNPTEFGKPIKILGVDEDAIGEVHFYTFDGKLLFVQQNKEFFLPNLQGGIYFAKLFFGRKMETKKIVVP